MGKPEREPVESPLRHHDPWMCPQWREQYVKAVECEVRRSEGVQGEADREAVKARIPITGDKDLLAVVPARVPELSRGLKIL
ncbi:MAG: hypothetical protein Kow00128_02250 [Deltaproteobacteria bacterium]